MSPHPYCRLVLKMHSNSKEQIRHSVPLKLPIAQRKMVPLPSAVRSVLPSQASTLNAQPTRLPPRFLRIYQQTPLGHYVWPIAHSTVTACLLIRNWLSIFSRSED